MTFQDALLDHGLRPKHAVHADGKWHRCATESHPRKKNGSYRLAADGLVGWYMDYAIDAKCIEWRPDRVTDATPYDPRIIAAAKERQRREMQDATKAAREYYAECQPLVGTHTYLESHGLDATGCNGVRINGRGALIIPAYHKGDIQSIQSIQKNGEKRFWPGAPMQHAAFVVERRGATLTVLCEGLATGLAIYAAVPTTRIVVAFNSGNLSHVAKKIGTGLVVVASDNDWETEARIGKNPGVVAATEAASIIGCGVAIPQNIEGTDWCDYRGEIFNARVAIRSKYERDEAIQRAVDALIAGEIMRNAKFITPKQTA